MMQKYVYDFGEGVEGEVEAVQLTKMNAAEVAEWCNGLPVTEIDAVDSRRTFAALNIHTDDGMRRASEGDWVIKHSKTGDFYINRNGTFHNFYKAVE